MGAWEFTGRSSTHYATSVVELTAWKLNFKDFIIIK